MTKMYLNYKFLISKGDNPYTNMVSIYQILTEMSKKKGCGGMAYIIKLDWPLCFTPTFTSYFTFLMVFHIAALILSLK